MQPAYPTFALAATTAVIFLGINMLATNQKTWKPRNLAYNQSSRIQSFTEHQNISMESTDIEITLTALNNTTAIVIKNTTTINDDLNNNDDINRKNYNNITDNNNKIDNSNNDSNNSGHISLNKNGDTDIDTDINHNDNNSSKNDSVSLNSTININAESNTNKHEKDILKDDNITSKNRNKSSNTPDMSSLGGEENTFIYKNIKINASQQPNSAYDDKETNNSSNIIINTIYNTNSTNSSNNKTTILQKENIINEINNTNQNIIDDRSSLCERMVRKLRRRSTGSLPTPLPGLYLKKGRFDGRLGNHMQQYAAAIGVALANRRTLVCSPRMLKASGFKLQNFIWAVPDGSLSRWKNAFEGPDKLGVFDPSVMQLDIARNISLLGFRSSFKYWINNKDVIRDEYRFKIGVRNGICNLMNSVGINVSSNVKLVGIHVRRGDMMEPRKRALGFTIASPLYFLEAMNLFREKYSPALTRTSSSFKSVKDIYQEWKTKTQIGNSSEATKTFSGRPEESGVLFVVVSKNGWWARRHLAGGDVLVLPAANREVHLAALAACDDVIMSVGSFGWWGAWLAGGDVVYTDPQFRPGSTLANSTKNEDQRPPEWLGLPDRGQDQLFPADT